MDKRVSIALALLIVLVGGSVLAVGAVAAGQDIRESRQERAERAVGNGLTLGVRVVDADGEPVPGAHVTIVLVKDGQKSRIDRDETDRRGAAVFELRAGGYEVHVSSDAGNAVEGVRLHESQRLQVTLDPPERQRPARG